MTVLKAVRIGSPDYGSCLAIKKCVDVQDIPTERHELGSLAWLLVSRGTGIHHREVSHRREVPACGPLGWQRELRQKSHGSFGKVAGRIILSGYPDYPTLNWSPDTHCEG